jgi:hypothetical protein
VYTDATLARELVAAESKRLQCNTIPKCIWDWTCQKKSLEKNEAKMYTDHTLTSELVLVETYGYYTCLGDYCR